MRTVFELVLVVLLVSWAIADPVVINRREDICATAIEAGTNTLTRVENIARVTYAYNLKSDNRWTQFPDLAISFYLPYGQAVTINYNIQVLNPETGNFCTRLIIDGRDQIDFRVTTGKIQYHSHVSWGQVWL